MATEVALTVPVLTVAVMYCELDEAPIAGPTTTRATAPTPTMIMAIAANLTFMFRCLSRPTVTSTRAEWERARGRSRGPLAQGMAPRTEAMLN